MAKFQIIPCKIVYKAPLKGVSHPLNFQLSNRKEKKSKALVRNIIDCIQRDP